MQDLRTYQVFDSVQQMDKFVCEVLETFDLNETDRSLLRMLASHSLKILGCSWLKVQSIADMLSVSYRTAQRSLGKMVTLGVLQRVQQYRPKRGGNTSSLCIFRPQCLTELSERSEAETPELEHDESTSDQTEAFSSKANPLKELKERKEEPVLDHTYLENSIVPESFILACKPFYDSAKEIYTLWRKAVKAGSMFAPEVLDYETVAIQAFKQSVFALKLGKIRGSFRSYFFGVLRNMFAVEQRRAVSCLRNWLE
ncbi:helix-turn-helix domain-containing protein [Bacillus gobiensis]|uniref:helix-turn-helix domain-containing protein n=1 Tax=Bacillus gobiensis TaxID=1441095 RepID=UPI003D1BB67A